MKQPSDEECSKNQILHKNEDELHFATFDYPQMGGYCSHSLVQVECFNSCFEVKIWHDGEFPFADDKEPIYLHHCDPIQFINLGLSVIEKRFSCRSFYMDFDEKEEMLSELETLQKKLESIKNHIQGVSPGKLVMHE